MAIELELPSELEDERDASAASLSLAVSDYILRILTVRPLLESMPKTGAELVAYWQQEGVIGSRPDITDSQAYVRQLRHEAETRPQNQRDD